jgi:acyl-CoA thioester hydrolase
MDLGALPVTYQAAVREEHLDLMGHLNVMWYAHFFDEATWRLFADLGMDEAYYERETAGAFALAQYTRYLAEVRLGQALTIRSRVLGRSTRQLHFIHFMTVDESGKLAATTELLGIHVDRRVRRSSPFPPTIAAAVDEVLARHRELEWAAPVCGAIGL